MSVFFTSDWHLGHNLAATIRGFSSVEEHDDTILGNMIEDTTKNDKIYVLGDIAFSKRALVRVREIPSRIALIPGNHDKFSAWDYLAVVDDVIASEVYKNFILTHIPIHPQEMLRWKANLHGHIHAGGLTPNLTREDRYYNVCVDFNNNRPVPYEYLNELFSREERV